MKSTFSHNRKIQKNESELPSRELLWGDGGPYSEIHLTIETRIIDDSVSRLFVNIDLHINPYTFSFIRKHRKDFPDDPDIQSLIDHAEYRGEHFGYVSCAFHHQFSGEDVLRAAQERERQCRELIIKLHKAVMKHLKMPRGRYRS